MKKCKATAPGLPNKIVELTADEIAIRSAEEIAELMRPIVPDPQVEFEAAIAAATTIAGLKAALLGTGGNAKAKGGVK